MSTHNDYFPEIKKYKHILVQKSTLSRAGWKTKTLCVQCNAEAEINMCIRLV